MPDTVPPRATYADIEAAPEHLVAELIHGELVTHPRPRPKHTATVGRLFRALANAHADEGDSGDLKRDCWKLLIEPEVHFQLDVLSPDLAGWRRERLPLYPARSRDYPIPNWICEVSSPSTRTYDRGPKLDIYAMGGVGHVWLIDPDAEQLEAFELTGGRYLRLGAFHGTASASVAPFDDPALELGRLWKP